MIRTKEELLALMDATQCPYEVHDHPAVFTVKEAEIYCHHIPGAHVKNLFLRNKKKTFYALLTVHDETQVDLNRLTENFSSSDRLSFASNEDVVSLLGVQPGSVTPVAILNDTANKVQLFFDKSLLQSELINIHPMVNTATITLTLENLISFIETHRKQKIQFIPVVDKRLA